MLFLHLISFDQEICTETPSDILAKAMERFEGSNATLTQYRWLI